MPRGRPASPNTLRHFETWAGRLELEDGGRFRLQAFQRAFVADLLELADDGLPRFRELLLVVPEANGKTTLVSVVALYHLRHREQAYVPIAAAAQEQSLILFRQAEGFVRRSNLPEFDLRPGVREIRCRSTGGVLKAKAADERTGDGLIPTLAICDELHRHRDLGLYRVWRGKVGKRRGQLVAISTAGEPGSDFEELRDAIRQGALRDRPARRVHAGVDGHCCPARLGAAGAGGPYGSAGGQGRKPVPGRHAGDAAREVRDADTDGRSLAAVHL